MLISIHMPKTAGLSFRETLEGHYGDRFRADYGDYPLAQSASERRNLAQSHAESSSRAKFSGIDCIHGHFLPAKYLPLTAAPGSLFVTWLREPVARLVSHYAYWQTSYEPAEDSTSTLHRRVVEEGWDLEQFCLAPQMRNVYSEFLWGFPTERLDFIGITEYFAEDMRYFCTHFLGLNAEPARNNSRGLNDAQPVVTDISPELRGKIEEYHSQDVSLYRRALALRGQRNIGVTSSPVP